LPRRIVRLALGWCTVLATGICTGVALLAGPAALAAKPPPVPANPGSPIDPGGGFSAGASVSPGTQGISAHVVGVYSGPGGGRGKSTCDWFPGTVLGRFKAAKTDPATQLTLHLADGSVARLYGRQCADGDIAWVWVAPVTALQVANVARDKVKRLLPIPRAVFSPALSPSSPAVVHVPLWFAVPEGQWHPVSATATVQGVAATVTATPQRLALEPGDKGRTVGCAGPGLKWRSGMAEPDSPPPCSYEYVDASSVAPNGRSWGANLSIRWQVAWVASTGESGDLEDLTTVADYAIPVSEMQGVEIGATGRG
jgi:hypothetical protein